MKKVFGLLIILGLFFGVSYGGEGLKKKKAEEGLTPVQKAYDPAMYKAKFQADYSSKDDKKLFNNTAMYKQDIYASKTKAKSSTKKKKAGKKGKTGK